MESEGLGVEKRRCNRQVADHGRGKEVANVPHSLATSQYPCAAVECVLNSNQQCLYPRTLANGPKVVPV